MTISLRSTKNIWDSSIDFNYVNYSFPILNRILHNVSCANQYVFLFLPYVFLSGVGLVDLHHYNWVAL